MAQLTFTTLSCPDKGYPIVVALAFFLFSGVFPPVSTFRSPFHPSWFMTDKMFLPCNALMKGWVRFFIAVFCGHTPPVTRCGTMAWRPASSSVLTVSPLSDFSVLEGISLATRYRGRIGQLSYIYAPGFFVFLSVTYSSNLFTSESGYQWLHTLI